MGNTSINKPVKHVLPDVDPTKAFLDVTVDSSGTFYELKSGSNTRVLEVRQVTLPFPPFNTITLDSYDLAGFLANVEPFSPFIALVVENNFGDSISFAMVGLTVFLIKDGVKTLITEYSSSSGEILSIHKDPLNNYYISVVSEKLIVASVNSGENSLWKTGQTTEGLINQATNGHEKYLSINYTPLVSGKFSLETYFIWSMNVVNDNFQAEFSVENLTDGIPAVKYPFIDKESGDSAGSGTVLNVINNGSIVGNVTTGTDIKNPSFNRIELELIANKNYEISLDWRCQSINDEATIHKGDLMLKKI